MSVLRGKVLLRVSFEMFCFFVCFPLFSCFLVSSFMVSLTNTCLACGAQKHAIDWPKTSIPIVAIIFGIETCTWNVKPLEHSKLVRSSGKLKVIYRAELSPKAMTNHSSWKVCFPTIRFALEYFSTYPYVYYVEQKIFTWFSTCGSHKPSGTERGSERKLPAFKDSPQGLLVPLRFSLAPWPFKLFLLPSLSAVFSAISFSVFLWHWTQKLPTSDFAYVAALRSPLKDENMEDILDHFFWWRKKNERIFSHRSCSLSFSSTRSQF